MRKKGKKRYFWRLKQSKTRYFRRKEEKSVILDALNRGKTINLKMILARILESF